MFDAHRHKKSGRNKLEERYFIEWIIKDGGLIRDKWWLYRGKKQEERSKGKKA